MRARSSQDACQRVFHPLAAPPAPENRSSGSSRRVESFTEWGCGCSRSPKSPPSTVRVEQQRSCPRVEVRQLRAAATPVALPAEGLVGQSERSSPFAPSGRCGSVCNSGSRRACPYCTSAGCSTSRSRCWPAPSQRPAYRCDGLLRSCNPRSHSALAHSLGFVHLAWLLSLGPGCAVCPPPLTSCWFMQSTAPFTPAAVK